MNRIIKSVVFKFAEFYPISLFLKRYKSNLVVFCFHRIVPENMANCHTLDEFTVSDTTFEKFLVYVKKNYICLPLEDALYRSEIEPENNFCHVTFDDGYLDFLEYGLPLIQRYEVPTTLYVTTGYINRTVVPFTDYVLDVAKHYSPARCDQSRPKFFTPPNASELSLQKRASLFEMIKLATGVSPTWNNYMSVDELVSLRGNSLLQIGSHTISHPNLVLESEETRAREITESMEYLQKLLATPITAFAYPYGGQMQFDMRSVDMVCKAGYKTAVTALCSKLPESMYLIPRLFVTQACVKGAIEVRAGGLSNFLGRQFVG